MFETSIMQRSWSLDDTLDTHNFRLLEIVNTAMSNLLEESASSSFIREGQ